MSLGDPVIRQRSRAFAPNLGLGPPKGVSIDRLSGVVGASHLCWRGFISVYQLLLLPWGQLRGVAAVLWCWLCAVCAVAVGHVGCCVECVLLSCKERSVCGIVWLCV